ncbi:MAG: glycosyltransferase [Chitinophagaceae bacterium]|nr:glycosyltransferase [Chitinophagaceae bacterium]
MQCPVICSAIEGNVDVVADKETGLLFQPRNTNDLLEKLNYALTHKEEMQNKATNLRRQVEKKFDQKYLHACLKGKYLEILNAKIGIQ